MNKKIKWNFKRYVGNLLLVAVLFLGLNMVILAAETLPQEARNAALQGMDNFITSNNLPDIARSSAGFSSVQASSAILGEGFQVYRVNETELLNSTRSFDRIADPTDIYRFLVVSENQPMSLVTVGKFNNEWTTIKVGARGIAEKFQQILKTWPATDGFTHRFIRVYNATLDLVEISVNNQVIGYVPLSPIQSIVGVEDPSFDPSMLYYESDFRIQLRDRVEMVRRNSKKEEVSNNLPKLSQENSFSVPQSVEQLSSTNDGTTINLLDFPENFQEHSNWCWAATCQNVFNYYNIWYEYLTITNPDGSTFQFPLLPMMQCYIVDWAMNEKGYNYDSSCGNNAFYSTEDWNAGNSIYGCDGSREEIYNNWGVSTTRYDRALTLDEIKAEIDAGHPIDLRFGWYDPSDNDYSGNGGHALAGFGYHENIVTLPDGTTTPFLQLFLYVDPWPGEGFTIGLYSLVAFKSGDHIWNYSLSTSY